MIDLTKILVAIIELIAAILTWKILPLIKAKTTAEQQKKIDAVVQIAIFAAEQLFGAGHGEEKLKFAQHYLNARGIEVDRAQIEAAVYKNFNSFSFLTDEEPELTKETEE